MQNPLWLGVTRIDLACSVQPPAPAATPLAGICERLRADLAEKTGLSVTIAGPNAETVPANAIPLGLLKVEVRLDLSKTDRIDAALSAENTMAMRGAGKPSLERQLAVAGSLSDRQTVRRLAQKLTAILTNP